jgi:hypothetical protein
VRAALPDAELLSIVLRTRPARLQAVTQEIAVGKRASWEKRCSQRRLVTVRPISTNGGVLKNRRYQLKHFRGSIQVIGQA